MAKRVNDAQSEAAQGPLDPSVCQLSDAEHLSPDQTTVRQHVSKLSRVPDVRQEQVNALRLDVQSGQFQRSNDLVAGAVFTQLFGIQSNR